MASAHPLDIENPNLIPETKFLDAVNFEQLFTFSKDILYKDVAVNEMDKPVLSNYYLRGWRNYGH